MDEKLERELAAHREHKRALMKAKRAQQRAENPPPPAQRFTIRLRDKACMRDKKNRRNYQDIDWKEIIPDWKAGLLPLKKILEKYAEKHEGYSPAENLVYDYMRRNAIPRDLNSQIAAVAQAKDKQDAGVPLTDTEVALLEARKMDDEIIEVNAAAVAGALIGHRRQVRRFQDLMVQLLGELEAQTINQEDLQKLGELMYAPDQNDHDKLYDIYQKIIATPARIDGMKKLVEAGKMLIGLERQALGVSDNALGLANQQPQTKDITPEEAAQRVAFMLLMADRANAQKEQMALRRPLTIEQEIALAEEPEDEEVSDDPSDWA